MIVAVGGGVDVAAGIAAVLDGCGVGEGSVVVGCGVNVAVRVGTALGGWDVEVLVGGTEVDVCVGTAVWLVVTDSVGWPQAPRPKLRINTRSSPPRNLILIEHPPLQLRDQNTAQSPKASETVSMSMIRAKAPPGCMTGYDPQGVELPPL